MKILSHTMIALAGLAVVLSACAKRTYKEVPDEAVGVWKTPAEKYADRFFELKKDSVTFGIGDGGSETYAVLKTEVQPEGGDNLYCVYYVGNDGDIQQWSFYLPAGGQGSLRLKSQKSILWTKHS